MKHDLIHIQGKPYVLVPLHEFRMMAGGQNTAENADIPETIIDDIFAGTETPLRILRQYRGLTQEELAEKAGLSRPYLTEIETGRKNGSVKALNLLAKALGVEPGLLLQPKAA